MHSYTISLIDIWNIHILCDTSIILYIYTLCHMIHNLCIHKLYNILTQTNKEKNTHIRQKSISVVQVFQNGWILLFPWKQPERNNILIPFKLLFRIHKWKYLCLYHSQKNTPNNIKTYNFHKSVFSSIAPLSLSLSCLPSSLYLSISHTSYRFFFLCNIHFSFPK